MKIDMRGADKALRALAKRKSRIKSQRPAWQAGARMLTRRYLRVWFGVVPLGSSGGGPENNPWPGLTGAHILNKLKTGKTQKLRWDGTLRLSYFARPILNGRGIITGVRDPNRGKLKGLSGLGFELMTLEDSMRITIFDTVRRYLETGKL